LQTKSPSGPAAGGGTDGNRRKRWKYAAYAIVSVAALAGLLHVGCLQDASCLPSVAALIGSMFGSDHVGASGSFLTVDADDAVIRDIVLVGGGTDRGGTAILIRGAENVTISNVTISGYQTGIMIEASSFVTVRDSHIENTHRAIQTSRQAPERLAYNSIHNNTIKNSADSAIVMFGNHTSILGNTIQDSNWRGIELVSPFVNSVIAGNLLDNTRMEAIHLFGYRNAPHVPEHGRHAEASRNAYVVNNTITNFYEDAIELQNGVNFSFVAFNTISNSLSSGHSNGIETYIDAQHNLICCNRIDGINAGTTRHDSNGILVTTNTNVIHHNVITDVSGEAVRVNPNYHGEHITGLVPAGNVIYNNEG